MNVAAFIVAAINILHIIECSSQNLQRSTFFSVFSALDHLTLFTNSAASLPMTKFSESATSWKLILSGCPDRSRSIPPYLTDCASPSRRVSP